MKQRRAILVLGMHRSGTSALARVLSLRGADLPANLLSANRGNETGYWEPAPIVELNDQLLGYFGVDWDDPFAALQIPGADAFPERFHDRAQKLIEQEYGSSGLFVLKDPRITLLHDFWFAVLARMNIKVCPVVAMRPYTEVAESLQKRDQTNAESSVMLYVAYGVEVAASLQKHNATFLTYEQLVFDWRGTTDRIATEQGFKWAKTSAYTDMEVADFLVERPVKARKIHLSNTLECWASIVWDWFRTCAEGDARDVSPLTDIRAQLTEAAKTYSPLLAERRRRYRILQSAQSETESAVKEGFRALIESQTKLENTAQERDAFHSERDRLLALYETTNAELSKTQDSYRALDEESGHAKSQLGELQRQLEKLENRHEVLAGQRDGLQSERDKLLALYDAANAELNKTQGSYRTLEDESARQKMQLDMQEKAQTELQRQLERFESRYEALAGQRDGLQAERDKLLALYESTNAELSKTQASYRTLEDERARILALHQQELDTQHAQMKATLHEQLAMRDTLLEQAKATLHMQVAMRDALQSEHDALLEQERQTDAELMATQSAYQQLVDERNGLLNERSALVEERNTLFDERNSLLALYRQTDDALAASNAAFATRSEELAYTRAALEMAMKRAESLRGERDARVQAHELTQTTLASSQHDAEQLRAKLEQTTQRAAAESRRSQELIAQLKQSVNELHMSSSWRITAPLRGIAIGGRKLKESAQLIWPLKMKPLLRLPAPTVNPQEQSGSHPSLATATTDKQAAQENRAPISNRMADTDASQPAHVPAFTSRDHPTLRHFLNEEFDPLSADDVILRIDRYRLPVDNDAIRTAARASCSEADVAGWVDGISRLAAARPALGEAVDVSIVIPVYNQIQFTLACVESLLAHDTRYRFEILIGDDASTDATEFAFSKPIPGVRHVRHSSNLGFVRNCNATTILARGRYVVMLNNDTQVLPNWLDELIGTLERDARIGLSGSKLIYPDGRMQECGGIVWRDGSAWNFGRLDDPRRPECSYMRDVDFISGASIALSSELWRQLGGFDDWFAPAYAEDADMAFRVRALGLRTVVQPLSQILHFEGISSGTDLTQGAKAYQVENLKKLYQRWQGALTTHRANADRPDLEKERTVGRRMLFIDHCTPTPNEDAGSLVAVEIMHAFRDSGFKVTFIPEDNFAHMGATTRDLQRLGIETIYHPSYSSMPAFLAARNDPFDVIFLLRFRVGEAHMQTLCEKFPLAKVIFSNCDLHFLREMREAELSGDSAAMALAHDTQRRELDVIRAADVNLVHSEIELDLLNKEAPDAVCTLFPLVHDPVDHIPPLSERDGLCFVGGYRHPPNADGIIWFVENVWPLIHPQVPSQKLYIAGSSMTAEVKALAKHPNVEIVGFVDDLEAFLAKRRATIAPLRFGAGAKGKIAVSLANGVPVVSTTIGSEGMQLTPNVNVLVANSEQTLATFAVEILSNDRLWHELSAAGLQYAADVTSRSSARARVRSIIAELGL